MPTIFTLVAEGRSRLAEGPHAERAGRDADALAIYVLGKSHAWLAANRGEEFPAEQINPYRESLERRLRGEPLQYITGETEFYGLPFVVTPDVLIPRPETEHLVEKAIEIATALDSSVTGLDFSRAESHRKQDWASAPAGFLRIVDVGTGSGAIAVALARHLPAAQITALDISQPALRIARQNAGCNGVSGSIRFLQGDLLEPLNGEWFDMIVSNPPYVPTPDQDSLAVEVRDYEPALALFAGQDGLDIYRRLIPAAYPLLAPGGFLLLEIGQGQSEAVGTLLENAGFGQIEFVPDLQSIPRVVCGRRG